MTYLHYYMLCRIRGTEPLPEKKWLRLQENIKFIESFKENR